MIERRHIGMFIGEAKLATRFNDFVNENREPQWDSDNEDGQWCIPEMAVVNLLNELLKEKDNKGEGRDQNL